MDEEWKEHTVKRHSFVVTETPTFVPYEIKIHARNHQGWAPEPRIVSGFSGEDCEYLLLLPRHLLILECSLNYFLCFFQQPSKLIKMKKINILNKWNSADLPVCLLFFPYICLCFDQRYPGFFLYVIKACFRFRLNAGPSLVSVK